MAKLHLSHAIIVRLNVYETDVVILTPETADIVGVLSSSLSLSAGFSIQGEAMDAARSAPQGFTTMWTLFTCSLNGEITREHGDNGTPG